MLEREFKQLKIVRNYFPVYVKLSFFKEPSAYEFLLLAHYLIDPVRPVREASATLFLP